MPLSSGQILNNRYRVVNLLGQGGFGAVYRVWETNIERPLALKENLDTTPEAQRQFKREAQILFDLSHPHLPRVIDYFIIPGQGQYLVMDFVEGEDLQEMLQRVGGSLPEAQVLEWIRQICDALEYLHNQTPPIIHRDIKPANIKITPKGQAMLVDFGIAKIYDPKLATTLGARAVTPGYSPPEQYGQGKTDQRSDIYALGATLYHLLTGQKPADSVDLITRNAPPPVPAKTLNPRLSPRVDAALLHAMQLDRDQRTRRISEFHNSLVVAHTPTVKELQVAGSKQATAAQVAPPRGPVTSPVVTQPVIPWGWVGITGILIMVGIIFLFWLLKISGGNTSTTLTLTLPPVSEATADPTAIATATDDKLWLTLSPAPIESLTVQPSTPTGISDSGAPIVQAYNSTNCREGPDKQYPVIGVLSGGEQAIIHGRSSTLSDDTWWYIINPSDPGTYCWIWGAVTDVQGDTTTLPVIIPPPRITPPGN